MTVYLEVINSAAEIDCRGIKDVWEIQDNGHSELVIKLNDHSCIRYKEKDIKSIEVKL